jgi:recombinational DNA repair ATPase RecF
MEHSDQWIVSGWHREQWVFQNNEKTMERTLASRGQNNKTR